MFVRCIGTGSSGNCYALYDNDGKILLLDLGLARKEILKGIDFNVSDVVGAVVSHGHGDHAKAVKDFENMGIPVFKPYDKAIKKVQYEKFGGFTINAFPMLDKEMETWQHTNTDGSECPCYGFYIKHEDMGQMVYVTDTKCISHNFSKMKLNHVLISSNYDNELLEDNEKREHVLRGHLSIQYVCEEFIKPNKSNALRTIVLCHLSQQNSDPDKMLSEVQKVVGEDVKCVCAAAGETVELSLYPF